MSVAATVRIAEDDVAVTPEAPFVFGRETTGAVVGLDPQDMGISAVAGSVEWDRGLWWVVNRSAKCHLLLETTVGGAPQRLDSGQAHTISVTPMGILVEGAIRTHRLRVTVPDEELARYRADRVSSGTLTAADLALSARDRAVLVAVCGGYLQEFPRQQRRPRTYEEAARLLGDPWTKHRVQKQMERLKKRVERRTGRYFEGLRANDELAEYLIDNRLLTTADLDRLRGAP